MKYLNRAYKIRHRREAGGGGVLYYDVEGFDTIGFGLASTVSGVFLICNHKYLEHSFGSILSENELQVIAERCVTWADNPISQEASGSKFQPTKVRIVSDYTELPPPQW